MFLLLFVTSLDILHRGHFLFEELHFERGKIVEFVVEPPVPDQDFFDLPLIIGCYRCWLINQTILFRVIRSGSKKEGGVDL